MRKSIMVSAGLIALAAFPAMADGYKDAPPPNRGPSALSPHEQEARTYDDNVRVVYVERDTAPVRYVSSGCGCCCAPVSYSRTYTTEPGSFAITPEPIQGLSNPIAATAPSTTKTAIRIITASTMRSAIITIASAAMTNGTTRAAMTGPTLVARFIGRTR